MTSSISCRSGSSLSTSFWVRRKYTGASLRRTSMGLGRAWRRSPPNASLSSGCTVRTRYCSSSSRFSSAVPVRKATCSAPAARRATAWLRWASGFLTEWASSTATRSTGPRRSRSFPSVVKVVMATPPSRCHCANSSSRSNPWMTMAPSFVCLRTSRSQLMRTAFGATTKNRRLPWAARWHIAASTCMVLPKPMSSPSSVRRWCTRYWAPKSW